MSKARDIARAGTALSNVDATELGYLDGVTSNVQTQLNTNATAASTAQTTANAALPSSNYFTAGKNAVINGGFDIWQRGTSFSANYAYTADRWQAGRGGGTLNITVSRQNTNDTTNLPNIQYCARVQRDNGVTTTNTNYFGQNFETVNSIPFTGKIVTVSFYARAGANFSSSGGTMTATLANGTGTDQNYLIGQYTNANTIVSLGATLTTTWQRFTMTGTVPTNSTELAIQFSNTPVGTAGANDYFEITGVQLELGSSATPFSRAGGTIQGELAACQRYYWRLNALAASNVLSTMGTAYSTSGVAMSWQNPVPMRVKASSIDYSALELADFVTAATAITSATADGNSTTNYSLSIIGVAGTPLTQYRNYAVRGTSSSGYIGFNAEL